MSALFKNKGDKTEPSNYRPVSLTCITCKLTEKIVRSVIVNHMTTNELFSTYQCGFRIKRSCVLQLLDAFDDLTRNYDNGHQTDIVYLDIKKAFDTVPHRRLLLKLKSYGFEGKLLSWIENFLMNRRQRVVLKG